MKVIKPLFQIEKKPKKGLFAVEWVMLGYTVLTLLFMLVTYTKLQNPVSMLWGRFQAIAIMAAMWAVYRMAPCRLTRFCRIGAQLLLLSWWYPDTYEMNRILPNLDHIVAEKEQWLFGCQPALLFSQALPGTMVSELMNLGYTSYFPMIATVTIFYFLFRYEQFMQATFIILTAFFAYYVMFILLPVTGPQYYYQAVGLDQIAAGSFPNVHDYFLTLREALLQADKSNIDLEKARIRIETAQAQLKQAWAIFLPNVSGKLTYAHLGKVPSMDMSAMTGGITGTISEALAPLYQALHIDPTQAAGQNAGASSGGGSMKMAAPDSVTFELTAGVSLINVAGWFQLKMLDEAKTLTELGIADGRQQLLFGVAQAYLAALLCGEVVKVQRIQLKSALDQLTLAQGRFDRGADVRLSVIQAQFAVEKQRQTLIDAIWSYETARDALATLINVDGLPVPQPTKFQGINISSDEELEKEALANNRTLRINEMTQHVNKLNLDAAIAGFLPTLSGAWVYSYTLTEPAGMTAQKYSWTLALSLSVPLFDYSKFGVLDERRAAMRATELERESTINTTKQNVRKAKREYYSALFNVDNAKRQFELAREAMQLTEAAYANGASTFIDVTNARNTVASAAIAYVTAGIQSELSLISLISVLGRDIMEVVY